MTPLRIQLRRTKGWRMPANTVKVDRTTRYGNDFIMAHEGMRAQAVESFRLQAKAQMEASPAFYSPLRGKNLACWCKLCDKHKDGKPLDVECSECDPCHVDPLGVIANAQ